MQDLALRLIRKPQLPAGNPALRTLRAARFRLRQVEQAEDLVACGHAVHRDVEKRAELAHGDEEIRRQQDNQQRAAERDMPRAVLRRRHDDAERRAAVGDEVHDRDGVELHRQHLHRDAAELLGLHVHLLVLGLVRLIDLQRRESL